MFPTTSDQWRKVLIALGVKQSTATRWAEPFAEVIRPDKFNLGEKELDDYLSQILHESRNLESMVEDMNYSAERMMKVWPSRFPTLESAKPFEYKPELLAEKVYGMRKDLGNDQPGDGWAHIGMGLPQITGKGNYKRVADLMGQDYTMMRYLLTQPRFILEASLAWWEDRIKDSAIDFPDRVRKLVQGGDLGLKETTMLAARARQALA